MSLDFSFQLLFLWQGCHGSLGARFVEYLDEFHHIIKFHRRSYRIYIAVIACVNKYIIYNIIFT